MSEHGALYDLAAAALGLLEQAFVAAEVDLPARRCVIPGAMSTWDCEQATAAIVRVAVGLPGRELGAPLSNCPPMRFATLRLEIVRCVPAFEGENGEAPSAAQIDQAAQTLLLDLDTLDRAARSWKGENALGGRGAPIAFAGGTPVGPEGNYAASRLDMDVPLLAVPA